MAITSADIKGIRTDYGKHFLLEEEVDKNPIRQLQLWLNEAIKANVAEPNAMSVSTVNSDGYPTSRIVLLRGVDENGLTFYSNYHSNKGKEIDRFNKVGITFFWPELERQVRICGEIEKLSATESDTYFASRPRESQIGAWVSKQSMTLKNRQELDDNETRLEKEFEGKTIPRPAHWGGYLVVPVSMEFWQGRPSRLHDRLLFTKVDAAWTLARLSP